MKKVFIGIISALLTMASVSCNAKTSESTSEEKEYDYVSLLADKNFKRGFKCWGLGLPIYGDEIELYGGDYEKETEVCFDYDIDQTKSPVWRLQQWATRYPFHDKENKADPEDYKFTTLEKNHYLYENKSKTLEVNTDTSEFRLALKASECYKKDREAGQEWPHLLLAEDFSTPAKPTPQMVVSNSESMVVTLDMKMNSFTDLMGERANPSLHSAICMFYLFVSYQPEGYLGYKDMIWLGMSLFDNREAYPNGMSCVDSLDSKGSATGKWIYNIGTSNYLNPDNNIYDINNNIQLDKWVSINIEVMPFISQALKEAQAGGCMKGATLDRLFISGMYIGFELPGTYDIDMSFKNMDVKSYIKV